MTNDNGVIDLIQLLEDMLEVRECAIALAISEKDSILASVAVNGIDSEVHRILASYATSAKEEAVTARTGAVTKFDTQFGFSFIMVSNFNDLHSALHTATDVARHEMRAEGLSQLSELAGTIVERAKGLQPMLFERTTVELIDLLKEHDDKQREQEKAKADTATASS